MSRRIIHWLAWWLCSCADISWYLFWALWWCSCSAFYCPSRLCLFTHLFVSEAPRIRLPASRSKSVSPSLLWRSCWMSLAWSSRASMTDGLQSSGQRMKPSGWNYCNFESLRLQLFFWYILKQIPYLYLHLLSSVYLFSNVLEFCSNNFDFVCRIMFSSFYWF